jgi:hypothetical protein
MSEHLPIPQDQPSFESLPLDQQLALSALADGCTYTDSATRAGVARVTLWRWIHKDPAFAEVFNAWKRELNESTRLKLLTAAPTASSAVLKAIDAGDAKLALSLLKSLGVFKAPK